MKQMKLTPLSEALDSHFGKRGTPRREKHETAVAEALQAHQLGEIIKSARKIQNLTQEELGERIGVKKAQVSRLEKGGNMTIPTMCKVFKALGIATATLDLGTLGKVNLW